MDWLNLSIVLMLVAAFGSSALLKLRNYAAFVEFLDKHTFLPALVLAWVIIVFEMALAVGFIVPASRSWAAIGAFTFVVLASGFIGWLLQGENVVDCMCWGPRPSDQGRADVL